MGLLFSKLQVYVVLVVSQQSFYSQYDSQKLVDFPCRKKDKYHLLMRWWLTLQMSQTKSSLYDWACQSNVNIPHKLYICLHHDNWHSSFSHCVLLYLNHHIWYKISRSLIPLYSTVGSDVKEKIRAVGVGYDSSGHVKIW